MSNKMKIGIIGAGSIAETMAKTILKMQEVELYAIASRDIIKANNFAEKYHVHYAYASYEELVKNPQINLVYIATPHSLHYEHAKLCIDNSKNVLCEKAFTMNAAQAKKLIQLAKKKSVYLAEAIWTRYMPSRDIINSIIKSGIVGEIKSLSANLAYSIEQKERIIKPELAGGALLDVGVYCLNFAFMHFGTDIKKIDSIVQMTKSGVDKNESIVIHYKDGKTAFLTSAINCRSDRKGIFWGDKGYIIVENINNPESISVYDAKDKLLYTCKAPKQISGYEYEVYEALKQIQNGKIESVSMPFSDTIFVMEQMDKLRKSWNMIYPQEK